MQAPPHHPAPLDPLKDPASTDAENPWKLALESSGSGVWDWDLVTGDQSHSARWKEMLGFAGHEIGRGAHEFFSRVHPDDLERVKAASAAYLEGRAPNYALDVRLQRKDGSWIWVMVHGMVVSRDAQGHPTRVIGTHTDITARKKAENRQRALNRQLQEQSQLLRAMQSLGHIGGWEYEVQTGRMVWTEEMYRILDLTGQDHMPAGADIDRFLTPASARELRTRIATAQPEDKPLDLELEMVTASGRPIWVHAIVNLSWDEGQQVKRIAMVQDITERKRSESMIWQQAHFDNLTGLPNRRMFRDRLEHEMRKSRRDGQQLAVLFLDLDRFKEVNDTLGHDHGDLLLVEAARRIRTCVRETDTVARMGGDEFTVLLTELDSTSQLEGILQKLLGVLGSMFQLRHEQVFISGSIGVTIYPTDATEVEDLYKNADQALYAAKGAGRNRFCFFTPALQEAALMRVRLAADLRVALTERQFRVVYQPIMELSTGLVRKAEALIRWQHPVRGMVSPGDFIPVAETSGLIVGIGEWVFQQAAAQVSLWRRSLDRDFQVSINKSPVQFQHERRAGPWGPQLGRHRLPGESIVAEITEGLLLDGSASVTDRLLDLHKAGIKVALDDFGTGYSSLSYLHKFDIDFVKIDQAFVRNLATSPTDLALCKAIIVMAHELGMKVVAEGVETQAQQDLLAAAGCDYAQGYQIAHPMPPEQLEAFVRQQNSLI